MLCVAALQIGDPIAHFILVKIDDSAVHDLVERIRTTSPLLDAQAFFPLGRHHVRMPLWVPNDSHVYGGDIR